MSAPRGRAIPPPQTLQAPHPQQLQMETCPGVPGLRSLGLTCLLGPLGLHSGNINKRGPSRQVLQVAAAAGAAGGKGQAELHLILSPGPRSLLPLRIPEKQPWGHVALVVTVGQQVAWLSCTSPMPCPPLSRSHPHPVRLLQWEAEASDPLLSWVRWVGNLPVLTRVWGRGKTDLFRETWGVTCWCVGVFIVSFVCSKPPTGV